MATRSLTVTLVDVVGDRLPNRPVRLLIEGDNVHSSDDGTYFPGDISKMTDANGEVVFDIRPSTELRPDACYSVLLPRKGGFTRKTFTMPDQDANLRDLDDKTPAPPGGGVSGLSLTVEDEGAELTNAASRVNFIGNGVTASSVGGHVTVVIPGGGGGGTPPTPGSINVLMGTSDDNVAEASELSITATSGVGAIPAYANPDNRYVLIARLASEAFLTNIMRSDDLSQINQIGAFTRQAGTVTVGGEDYTVWVSNQALTQSADVTWTAS